MSEKITITITGVLALLDQGKSRKSIADHYGITMADCKRLFNHPKLKGKKAKKVEGDFLLVDDTIEKFTQETAHQDEVQESVFDTIQSTENAELPVSEEVVEEPQAENEVPTWNN